MSTDIKKNWEQYFRDFSKLRVNIDIIDKDVQFQQQGGKILYVVDTNIILFYANPLCKQSIEFSRTFTDEPDRVLKALAIALSEFIVWDGLVPQGEDDCILFPTPLIEEFIDKVGNAEREAERAIEKYNENFEKGIEDIKELIKDYNYNESKKAKLDLVDYLFKKYEIFIKSIYEDEVALEEANRFDKVNRNIVFNKLDKLESLIYSDDIKNKLLSNDNVKDTNRHFYEWLVFILKNKNLYDDNDINIKNDIENFIYTCRCIFKLEENINNNEVNAEIINNYNNWKDKDSKLIEEILKKHPYFTLHIESCDNPITFIKRITKLGVSSRVRNIDVVRELYQLDYFSNENYINKIKENEDIWLKELKDNKPNRGEKPVNGDAKTLAMLMLINEELEIKNQELDKINAKEKFKKNNGKIKILYISTDAAAYKSANTLVDSNKIKDNFLRNPKQYVYFLGFGKKQYGNLTIIDNLRKPIDDFLKPIAISPIKPVREDYTKDYKYQIALDDYKKKYDEYIEIISGVAKNAPININDSIDALSYIQDQYTNLKVNHEALLILSTMDKRIQINEKKSTLEKLLFDHGICDLIEVKHKESFKYMSTNLESLGALGISAKFEKEVKKYLTSANDGKEVDLYTRGPVTLRRYNDDPIFEQIHEIIWKNDWETLLRLMSQETPYIKRLIMALVAADAGCWRDALVYCKDALTHEKKKNNEALYFIAVILRHNCNSYYDYLEAQKSLESFKNIWVERYSGRSDYRYESEKLSLETAYYNYDRFMTTEESAWKTDVRTSVPKIKYTWDSLEKLEVDILEEERLSLNTKVLPPIVSHRIKRQIYSNMLCLFLFSQYCGEQEINERDGKNSLKKMEDLIEKTENFRPSHFIHFLLAYTRWHFDKRNTEYLKDAINKTNNALNRGKHLIPYEKNKYEKFKEFLVNYELNLTNP